MPADQNDTTGLQRRWQDEYRERWSQPLTVGLCGLSALVVVYLVFAVVGTSRWAADFRGTYWLVAHGMLHGRSPYVWSQAQIQAGAGFSSLPVSAFLLAPAGLLSVNLAGVIASLIAFACVPAILWLLEARDLRVYAVALMLAPVFDGWHTANLTLPAALAVAAAWRWRDRPVVSGALVALAVSFKPYLWPAGLWLLASKRYRAAGWALALACLVNGLGFLVLGTGTLHQFIDLTNKISKHSATGGYGTRALLLNLGLAPTPTHIVQVLLALVLALACWSCARRRAEPAVLTLSLAVALVATPLAWGHYLVVLLVPLTILSPELSLLWLPLLVWWVCPELGTTNVERVIGWVAVALLIWCLVARARRRPPNNRARAQRVPWRSMFGYDMLMRASVADTRPDASGEEEPGGDRKREQRLG